MGEERRASEALPMDAAYPSITVRKKTGCGSLFVTVGWSNGKVVLVFARLGKGGGCANVWCHTTGELIAEALREGVPIDTVARVFKGVVCSSRTQETPSCLDAIAQVLEEYKTPGWGTSELGPQGCPVGETGVTGPKGPPPPQA